MTRKLTPTPNYRSRFGKIPNLMRPIEKIKATPSLKKETSPRHKSAPIHILSPRRKKKYTQQKSKKNHLRSSKFSLEKALSTNSMFAYIKKRKKIRDLQKISDIDFKTYENTKKKIIYGIRGTIILYDLRGFTYFCNQNKDITIPAKFMGNLFKEVDEIVYKWDGEIISRTGDGFVALFPKLKSEFSYKKSLNRAYQSSIELGCITDAFLKNQNIKNSPKKFGIGIEVGITPIIKNKKFSKLTSISPVARSINNAQRYEQHSKELLQKWKDFKPITLPERLYKLLPKKMQKIFKTKMWYLKDNKDYYKQKLNQQGITETIFVCSAPFERIKTFYKENSQIFLYKKRTIKSRLDEILDL